MVKERYPKYREPNRVNRPIGRTEECKTILFFGDFHGRSKASENVARKLSSPKTTILVQAKFEFFMAALLVFPKKKWNLDKKENCLKKERDFCFAPCISSE